MSDMQRVHVFIEELRVQLVVHFHPSLTTIQHLLDQVQERVREEPGGDNLKVMHLELNGGKLRPYDPASALVNERIVARTQRLDANPWPPGFLEPTAHPSWQHQEEPHGESDLEDTDGPHQEEPEHEPSSPLTSHTSPSEAGDTVVSPIFPPDDSPPVTARQSPSRSPARSRTPRRSPRRRSPSPRNVTNLYVSSYLHSRQPEPESSSPALMILLGMIAAPVIMNTLRVIKFWLTGTVDPPDDPWHGI